MRFFIIPKKMFKNQSEEKDLKRRFYKKKSFYIAVILLMFATIISVFILCRLNKVPSVSYCEGIGKFRLEAYSKEDREEFFEQFSYKAEEISVEEITIPCESVQFEEYNELQKSQGLDLMPYCGKVAKMYTMKLSGNAEEEELFGVLIVYKDKVIGAHKTDLLYPACVEALAP